MSYSEYVPTWERPVISRLIKASLGRGLTISVNDTEEYVLKRSSSLRAVQGALGGTGEDVLVMRRNGDHAGAFYLIYDNGSETDPAIVIADYTANDLCEEIYREAAQ